MKFFSKLFLGALLLTVFFVTTKAPTAAADFDLVVGIEVGESLTLEDIDWFAFVNSDSFDLAGPFLTEGDGSACVLGGKYGGDVVGKAPGTCLVKYIVEVDGNPQSLFFRVNVGGGSDTTVVPITVDADLVTEILVGESFALFEGFETLGLLDSSSIISFEENEVNLIEGDGSICMFDGQLNMNVVGKALGTCLVEARLKVANSSDPRVVYFRINVIDATVIDADLVTKIFLGESFALFEGFETLGLLDSSSIISFEENLIEGDGSVCMFEGELDVAVVGKALGTCLVEARLKVASSSGPRVVYFRINVIDATVIDADLVTEILVGETFVTDLGFKNLGLLASSSVYSLEVNLIEGDGSACVRGGKYSFDVVGKAPGTCLLKARLKVKPSPDWEVAYFRINVTVPPPTTIATAKTFVPLVDFEWTEARDANKDYFDLVQAIETWNLGYTGQGSVVAIIDGGFDVTHPDFTDRIILEVCLSDEYMDDKCPNGKAFQEGPGALYPPTEFSGTHGTGVAGAVHQFAPDARFIFIEPVGGGGGHVGHVGLAYDWVLNNAQRYGIDALVMSYGANVSQREALVTGEDCPDPEDVNEKFAAMKALGVVPIAASGNDGFLESAGGMPGCYEDVASVGWANQYGLVHMASNVNEGLTLLAPAGLQVAAAEIEDVGPYAPFAGTSGAAPVVGALIAIARQINPGATADELIELARSTAYSVDDFLVKDIRLVDFLTFSQTLAGVTVSPKKDIGLKPDGVVNLFVGESVGGNDLCRAGSFSLDCFVEEGVQKFVGVFPPERISGFASVCETPSGYRDSGVIVGVAPGTCFFSVEIAPYYAITEKKPGGTCPEGQTQTYKGCEGISKDDDVTTEPEFQDRLIQVNVETLDLSSVDKVLEIKVGELLEHDVFYATGVFPNNVPLGEPEFLRGEGSVCTLEDKQTYKGIRVHVFGKAPGTCVVKIKSQSRNPSVGYFAINVTE